MLPPGWLLLLILQFSELLSLEGLDFSRNGRCQGFRARWELGKMISWTQAFLSERREASAACWAPNAPQGKARSCGSADWWRVVPGRGLPSAAACHLGDTRPSPKGVLWGLGDPGELAMVSNFYKPWALRNSEPYPYILPSPPTLITGPGKWQISGVKAKWG